MRSLPAPAAALFIVAAFGFPSPARSIVLPPDFVAEDVAPGAGFLGPTAIAFMPDGRLLVGEKNGVVYVVQDGARRPEYFWNGTAEVMIAGNAGLTGMVVDPHYAENHFVYFAYVCDPDTDGVDTGSPAFGRVVRFKTAASDSNVVDPATKTVLIGRAWADGVPTGHLDHVIDGLRWGTDGSLLLSTGDGATADSADAGGHDPELFAPGRTDPEEDIGAYRSQFVKSLPGKILRINPETGEGYANNPFFDDNLQSNASKVWVYGLRNPWRFCVRPGTGSTDPRDGQPGTLYIGDVGWRFWEEFDVARMGGLNFGWPCYEGPVVEPDYRITQPSHNGWDSWGTNDNPSQPTLPVMSYHHSEPDLGEPPGFTGFALIGGTFYTGALYPPEYRNRYFYADYGTGWIRVADFDSTDHPTDVRLFATDAEGPVDFVADPVTGDLVYIAVNSRVVYHIRYTGPVAGNTAPEAHAAAAPLTGVAPLTVGFSSAGTLDADLDPLTLGWNFGDGLGSGAPNPIHLYERPGIYEAVLTADDRLGGVARDTVRIVALESGVFPGTPILDDFERPDGALVAPWIGDVAGLAVSDQSLELITAFGAGFWSGPVFGPDQEAYMSFVGTYDPATGAALILKGQTDRTIDGALLLFFDATLEAVILQASTPGAGWQEWSDWVPARFTEGDQFGARAYGNGVVEVMKNGAVIGTRSIADWSLASAGGRIGVALVARTGTRVDDFGGGDVVVSGNHPPVAHLLEPVNGGFYASGDTIRLIGSATDDRDAPEDLTYAWDVSIVHNTHIHPEVLIASGTSTFFIGENHDDGAGAHYVARLVVTDRDGLSDIERAEVFPEVDLEPRELHAEFDPIADTRLPTRVAFEIANHGRMPAPRSRWTLAVDGTTFAAGDTLVGSLDSVLVEVTLPPGLETGERELQVVVDTQARVRETREDNNTTLHPITVLDGVLGLAEEPRALWLGAPSPNPGRGRVSFALGLPAAARVEFTIRDLQGRRIWAAPAEVRPAGRIELTWGGLTLGGAPAPAGVYFARIEVDGRAVTRRFALLR